ncbi:TonB-dependent receptor [Rhodobacter capsulatus]|uniref:Vitamin B12 transporter n=1 Tax=Rhodobacter capsulatus TaxID=1061 RepID=A0A1G7NGL8_RHOCA|nr:TonB-dependent receptor [Rhodobacter capsulatus]WER09166.1 TonB-dependent receptor [Rhodobacter capsulatus]SDF73102.1 vitamin B12 transporter [Rhodobacter capsulatus]
MPPLSRLALLSAAFASAAAPALAQEEITDLDTISVTASAEPVKLSRTGASVDVLTEADLIGAPLSFGALVARLPGVTLTSNGGLGTLSDLRLRGLPGSYVGARIDGIDVSDPSSDKVKFDFGGLTTAGLSRIEVLRGSQSALYGSEAVAGVIDITSWRPEREGTSGRASLEGGSMGTLSAAGSVGVKSDRAELALSLARTLTDGFSASSRGTEKDGFRGTSARLHGRYALTDSLSLGANLIAEDSRADLDGTGADSADTVDSRLRGARVFGTLISGAVTQELALTRLRTERDYSYPAVYEGDRTGYAYTGRWTGSGPVSLSWGADRTEENLDVSSSDSRIDKGIATNAVFAEALWAARDDLDLSVALRHDQHSLFGGETSGRLGLAFRPSDAWVIRAVAATGFRAPSPYELWSDFGNTELQPEQSRSYEIGAERIFASGSIKATLFDTRITDKIDWDPNATSCKSVTNTGWTGCYVTVSGTTRARGIELEGKADLAAGWQVFGTYTYADADVHDKGLTTPAARAPLHVLVAGLSREFASGWQTAFSARHVADRFDKVNDTLVPMPDYTVADMTLSAAITDTTRASLRIENLFDADYETATGFNQPERAIYLGIGTTF